MIMSDAGPGQVLAQRLWVLERRSPVPSPELDDAHRFSNAIMVLSNASVYLLFVRTPEADRARAVSFPDRGIRLNLERDAFKFATLDEALEWADAKKQQWIAEGWSEAAGDPRDC